MFGISRAASIVLAALGAGSNPVQEGMRHIEKQKGQKPHGELDYSPTPKAGKKHKTLAQMTAPRGARTPFEVKLAKRKAAKAHKRAWARRAVR